MKRSIVLLIALVGLFSGLSVLLSCSSGGTAATEPVSIGTTTSEVNALILIAEEKGYFVKNGLDVTRKTYASGVAALQGMSGGEVNMATGSEFALAGEVLADRNVMTVGAISRSSIEYLVCRTDRGIKELGDLKGKRIGVPMGSRPEFALDRFLYISGIDASSATLVNVPVNKSVEALVSGEVDAVAAWQPYIDRIKAQLGDGVVLWDVQEDQPSYTLVMGTEQWVAANKQAVERVLKSLIQAEGFVVGNPEEAMSIVRTKLNYDEAYMASVWPSYNFSVSLDQALIVAMEDQARWIISNDSTNTRESPNFMPSIYEDGLKAVKPDAVKIIR